MMGRRLRLVASEASHVAHEVFGEIRPGGSSLARPRAYFLVSLACLFCQLNVGVSSAQRSRVSECPLGLSSGNLF